MNSSGTVTVGIVTGGIVVGTTGVRWPCSGVVDGIDGGAMGGVAPMDNGAWFTRRPSPFGAVCADQPRDIGLVVTSTDLTSYPMSTRWMHRAAARRRVRDRCRRTWLRRQRRRSRQGSRPALPPTAPVRTEVGNSGTCASHEMGPVTNRSRPIEMFKNARTTAGSNCPPEHLASSARASAADTGALYERADVITSNVSATATIRAEIAMSKPARPAGYPPPSQRSWCSHTARADSPSHGTRGATMPRP